MKRILSPLLLLAALFSFHCYADGEWPAPEMQPMNETKNITLPQMDRSSLPTGTLYVYQNHVTANEASAKTNYQATGYVCLSNSNSINGMCPSTVASSALDPTPITLRFTEVKSHITKDLVLYAQKSLISNAYYPRAMNSTVSIAGGTGSALTLYMQQSELKKLPVGGIWTAKLIINYRFSSRVLSTYTTHFLFDITDKSNIQVYMPQYGNAAMPQVDLNIRPKNNANGYAGKNAIDMCLYDGYNTNSSSMVMQFSGVNDGGSGTNTFYLHKNDDASVTLPYKVNFGFTGESPGRSIVNGESWSINQAQQLPINWNRITAVGLPNIAIPVLCWPAKLTISTDLPASQPAGAYSGVIKVVFTPDTTAM
ncbi:hypothetical protein AV650_08250 [Serratia fonticola]|nr:hypothetical protein AV650_08250 [Serratia fonticola]